MNLNTLYNFEKTYHGNYYCDCYNYSGCPKNTFGRLEYCLICQLGVHFNADKLFRNYNVADHIKIYQQLIKIYQKNPDLDGYDGDFTDKLSNNLHWSLYEYVFKSNYLRNCFE